MIFSIQRYLEDYFHRCGFADKDQYAVSVAKLYDRERHLKSTTAFISAMRRIHTVFYRRNAQTRRETFERTIVTALDSKFKKKGYSSSQGQSPQRLKLRARA